MASLLAAESNGDVVPEYRGVQAEEVRDTLIAPFNDLAAVERALCSGEVALILTEPAMTNFGLISPSADFHRDLRSLAAKYGTLLAIDETQTQACSFGGLSRLWNLESDALVIGKSMAGGIPLAAYGISEQLACVLEPTAGGHEQLQVPVDEPALGGTMFANAVSMAACRANLESVMTVEAYDHATQLAGRLVGGLRGTLDQLQLPWSIFQIGTRVWCCHSTNCPKNSREVAESDLPPLRDLQRLYLANRGIWDFGVWAGPIVGLPAATDDIDAYVAVWSELMSEVFETWRS